MKNSFVKYGILLVMSMAAVFIAKAGHPAFAMWILAMYAATLIYLSEVRQIKETARQRRLEERLAAASARERLLGGALVAAATKALWVESVTPENDKLLYKLEVPNYGYFEIELPDEYAPAAPNKG